MRLRFYLILLVGCLGSTTLLAKPDKASLEELKQEIAEIKQNQETLNQKVADAINQLVALQQEIAPLKGMTETGNHFYQEQTKSLSQYEQRISAMEDRMSVMMNLLQEIRSGKNPGRVELPTLPANPPTSTLPEKGLGANEAQTKEYQRLLDLVNTSDYAQALTGFQEFQQKFPKSALADQVQYWIGECYYALNDYKKAILEYQNVIQKYPRSDKVKGSLLKQGLSFVGLNMNQEAKPFFEKVVQNYPGSPEAARASQKLKDLQKPTSEALPTVPSASPITSTESQPQPNQF